MRDKVPFRKRRSQRLHVVPVRLWQSPYFIALVLLAGVAAGIWAGSRTGNEEQRVLGQALEATRDALRSSEDKVDELTKELASIRLDTGVSSGAVADLQANLNSQHLEIAALREEVAHYREILAPGSITKGTQISELRVVQTAASDAYAFELRLAQNGADQSLVRGLLRLSIEADAGGRKVVLPLQELSPSVAYPVRIGFRHFQHVSGKFSIPPEHLPLRVVVTLEIDGKQKKSLVRSFPWIVESL